MNLKSKIVLVVVSIIFSMFIGWKTNTIYTGYLHEKVLIQQEAVQETIRQSQATLARQFEEQRKGLEDLYKNNTNTVTTIIKNNQPIYSNLCLDDKGMNQLRKFREDSK